jgi:hypothetical protein
MKKKFIAINFIYKMSTKSWVKLQNMFNNILSSTLDSKSTETVMNECNAKKGDFMKLMKNGEKSRKKKDPSAPKKWNTSYIIFCSENREKIKIKNPNMSATQTTTKLGEEWKSLTEKEKKKYEDLSLKDKKRYEEEMKNYTPSEESEEEESSKQKKSKKKEKTGPKRPMSAYMYFCQEKRPEVKEKHPSMNGKEITTELGLMWRKMNEKDKKPYEDKQDKDKTRYHSEKNKDNSVKKNEEIVKEVKKETKKEVKKETNKEVKKEVVQVSKPKKEENLKTPGFDLFLQESTEEVQSEYPEWSFRKVQTEVEKRWKNLSQKDREAYEEEADEQQMSDEGSELELED